MEWKGHLGVNLSLAGGFVYLSSLPLLFSLLLSGILVSVSRLPNKDKELNALTHQGMTHTFPFAVVAGVVASGLTFLTIRATEANSTLDIVTMEIAVSWGVGLAITIGIVGHVLADTLTGGEIQPFAPFNDREVSTDLISRDNTYLNYSLLIGGGLIYIQSILVSVALPEFLPF